jgi:hypothetical protein
VRRGVRADIVSLASGAAIAALGALVLLDSSGAIELSLGWIAAALTGAGGVILLVSGLVNGGGKHHD